ncbi:hypothetical protein V8B55DRAFT_1437096 [Mucor lusitanicus]|uniref:Uncharacterized protein n=1 Tax=Mucor lusitanicus CBS 277.49 TaxID=747725 RepID=A0A168KUI4_MUCCL|nr:hypothetical protein MUCCIDRAFT_109624 [Mucor lusitanicus CBS 277.49]
MERLVPTITKNVLLTRDKALCFQEQITLSQTTHVVRAAKKSCCKVSDLAAVITNTNGVDAVDLGAVDKANQTGKCILFLVLLGNLRSLVLTGPIQVVIILRFQYYDTAEET